MLKTSLVIGASHFLGAHLVKRLLRLGFRVTALIDTNDSTWRLNDILDGLELRRANFQSPKDVIKIVQHYAPAGHVFYVSAYGEKKHQVDIRQTEYFNFILMKSILAEIIDLEFESFVYFGSYLEDAITPNFNYGDHDPATLEYRIIKGIARSHLIYESMKEGLPIYYIKPYHLYGTYFSIHTALGKFILDAAIKNTFTMSSIFLNKDYIHVKDFVNFSIMVAMLRPRNKVVFECGTGNVFKINEFKKLMINFLPQLKNELLSLDESLYQEKPEKILISNPLIMKELVSWEPTVSLETGFKEIFCWIQKFVILYPEYFKHKEDLIRLEIKNSGFY